MANVVENLGKLERRVTISLPKDTVQKEIDARIQKLAKNVRMPGFRPGKVPLKMVAQQYAGQVEAEVLSDKIGQEFFTISRAENLRVAGQPSFEPKQEQAEDAYAFDATFEVYPEVKIGDLATAEVERSTTSIGDAEIDRTLDILRKQRVHYHARGEAGEHGDGGADTAAKNGDRVTVDFVGKIDDVAFQGGTAEDFPFVLGEGRMLPEFETAALGLKVGEARTFDLKFPDDYHGKDVAGKTAQFTVTMKKIEWPHMPEIDAEFAKSLGIEDGDLTKMRAEIKENLEREAKRRTQSIVKNQVMDALLKISELDVPKALIEQDQQRLVEMARQDPRPARRAEREGRTDPGRDVRRAGRASRQAGPRAGRTGEGQRPRSEAGTDPRRSRRVREELRRPEGSGPLVLFQPAAPRRDGSVRR